MDKPKYTPVEMRTLVEVVRCEECKWHDIINQPYDIVYCRSICITVEDDWWCADGERRSDE